MSRILNQGDTLYWLFKDKKYIELLKILCMMSMGKYKSRIQILMCLHKSQLDRFNSKLDLYYDRIGMMLKCYMSCRGFYLTFRR